MRVLKLLGALPVIFWAQMVVSADIALILGHVGQVATMRNDTSVISSDFAGPLREAGFDIVQPKNRSSGNMRLAVKQTKAALTEGRLERLVIVVMGPLASFGGESWALSNGATGVTTQTVSNSGIAIGTLSSLAAAARSRAVILIAPGKDIEALGDGLMPGLVALKPVPEVTYFVGPAEALAGLLRDDLLDPKKSLAEIAGKASPDVQLLGFTSEKISLMGDDESD